MQLLSFNLDLLLNCRDAMCGKLACSGGQLVEYTHFYLPYEVGNTSCATLNRTEAFVPDGIRCGPRMVNLL